jgi:hypothetical protein
MGHSPLLIYPSGARRSPFLKRRSSGQANVTDEMRKRKRTRSLKILAKKSYEHEADQEVRASALHDSWWSSYADNLVMTPDWYLAFLRHPLVFMWLLARVRLSRKADNKRRSKKAMRRNPNCRTFLVSRIRKRMARSIKEGKGMKSGTSRDIIGCDWEALRAHLAAGFTPGMSWDNYGQYGWHIDHIKPLANYDMADPAQVRQAWHYSNLQPLWWTDNLEKSNMMYPHQETAMGCTPNGPGNGHSLRFKAI